MQIETRHFLLCALALAHLSLGTTAVLLSRHLQENWQQASIIIASLLVARFAGYRIVMDDLE